MIRRRTLAVTATAVAVAVLVTVGLGVRRAKSDEPIESLCKKDLAAVFEKCDPEGDWAGCKYADAELKEACQAGCVMTACPAQVTCTELDPLWCGTTCADPHTALYWKNLWDADEHCDYIHDLPGDEGGFMPWDACRKAYMKQQCPEFTGWNRQRWLKEDADE
jgi:hypothetical protein